MQTTLEKTLAAELQQLRETKQYKHANEISAPQGPRTTMDGHPVINLSSNTAAVLYFGYFGHVSWLLGAAMAASNLAGAQAVTVLALRHGSRLIRSVFIVVVCILIVKTGRDAWWAG